MNSPAQSQIYQIKWWVLILMLSELLIDVINGAVIFVRRCYQFNVRNQFVAAVKLFFKKNIKHKKNYLFSYILNITLIVFHIFWHNSPPLPCYFILSWLTQTFTFHQGLVEKNTVFCLSVLPRKLQKASGQLCTRERGFS